MTKELYEWLQERWMKDNHKKYQRYFDVWVGNITESQIEGYAKQERRRNVYG